MIQIGQIAFWCCVLALLHTYVFYPLLLRLLATGKKNNGMVFEENDANLPIVSIIMSVYNEEKVILEKLESLARLRYPSQKLFVYIGSDCSSDQTNAIISNFNAPSHWEFHNFTQRRGKPPVVNDLSKFATDKNPKGTNHVFVLTDASVMLEPDTLFHLVKHFKNPVIGVVDAHMRAKGMRKDGISRSENSYISNETNLKHCESLVWGKMIGPFGGCYALRSDLFTEVPPNYLVDDFYITFRVLEQGFSAINDLDAVCYEGATHQMQDEYRRKKRIAAGSFQNLHAFRKWVTPPATILGFAFFSHKVLRWHGGFLIALMWLVSGLLAIELPFYRLFFAIFSLSIVGVLLMDLMFEKLKITFLPLKNVAYFLAMNFALVAGFFKYHRGIKENTWQRTQRY